MFCLPVIQEVVHGNFSCAFVFVVYVFHTHEDLELCLSGNALCQVEHLLRWFCVELRGTVLYWQCRKLLRSKMTQNCSYHGQGRNDRVQVGNQFFSKENK